MLFNLEGKTALVTGASGGIGSECAKVLHKLGADVTISGTNTQKLESLASELGVRVQVSACDLSDFEKTEKLIDELEKIDILVCNAGITKDTLAMRMSNEDFDKVIDINLKSSFILNRSAIKKMIRNRWGRIINISSVVALSGNPGQSNYCASKAGLIGMSKSLALEVASRNVTVNCIAPGFIETNMTDKLTDEQKSSIISRIPLQSYGKAEDIAYGVAYLASNEARYITGQTLHINGGMYII
jgi:3-oxoacyl-[acyl-carrier protein] reductase